MFTLLVATALAVEPPPPDARLQGVHLGLGMSFYLITTSATDLELDSGLVGGSSVSFRLRLSEAVTLAPSVRASGSSRSAGPRADEENDDATEEYTSVGGSLGVELRGRLAHRDRIDLLGIVGVWSSMSELTEQPQPLLEDQGPETARYYGGSAEVGVGLEYWITPRISAGADITGTVVNAVYYESETEYEQYVSFGFSPHSAVALTFYF